METTPQSKSQTSLAPQKKTIELSLMGQKVTLRTQAESVQTDEITAIVKSRLAAAESRMKSGTSAPHLAAILALFDLAEEYVEAKGRVAAHQGELNEKVSRLRVLLND